MARPGKRCWNFSSALGKVFGAERLVRIRSAQVSGASYKTIGEYGLAWLSSLDARAVVPAVLNPIGMPRDAGRRWVSTGFAERQQAVIAAYERLGVNLECTCTPYYLHETSFGDHLAWSDPRRSVTLTRSSGHGQTGRGDRCACCCHDWKNSLLWVAS